MAVRHNSNPQPPWSEWLAVCAGYSLTVTAAASEMFSVLLAELHSSSAGVLDSAPAAVQRILAAAALRAWAITSCFAAVTHRY
jgi:hypothetical protein